MSYLKDANAFETAVDRSVFHRRSLELKSAITAIKAYVKGPTSVTLQNVINTVMNWRVAHKDEFAKRGQDIWDDLYAEIKAATGNKNLFCLDGMSNPGQAIAPLGWVQGKSADLDEFCTNLKPLGEAPEWAVTDAQTFADCAHPTYRGAVLQREQEWHKGNWTNHGSSSFVAMQANKGTDWDQTFLKTVYEKCGRLTNNHIPPLNGGGKGAVCTGFAYMAAHKLTANLNRPHPRVEVVAYPNSTGSHCYVLVGREGGVVNGNVIPDKWEAVIVDAWAAALGQNAIYTSRETYKYGGMITGLKVMMQLPAAP